MYIHSLILAIVNAEQLQGTWGCAQKHMQQQQPDGNTGAHAQVWHAMQYSTNAKHLRADSVLHCNATGNGH